MKNKLVIIGGGASGIAAAIYAGRICKNTEITILEKNDRIGKKLLRTGNGKCNITNDNASADSYFSPIARTALEEFSVQKTKQMLESIGIALRADDAGRNYPYSESAATLLNALLAELKGENINIITDFDVKKISKKENRFTIEGNRKIDADCIILAAGSPASVKNYDADKIFQSIGIKHSRFRPALCPLPSDEPFLKSLKGVRAKALVRSGEHTQEGEVQFNEKNISGICIFNLARYVDSPGEVIIDFMPEYSEKEITSLLKKKQKSSSEAAEICDGLILRKLAFVLIKKASLKPSQSATQLSEKDIENIAKQIKEFKVKVNAPFDFSASQVCTGGITKEQINPESLEIKNNKGIFVCGEILDVDAPCGGYNLQWAVSSGLNAAKHALKYLGE